MDAIFNDSWKSISEIIIYGIGMVGKKYFDMLRKDFTIKYIVDKSQNVSAYYQNIKVICLDEMMSVRKDEKIIVLASKEASISIKADLNRGGLIEYEDYVRFDDFVKEWYWQVKRKNCIREVHTSINTNCTFNCEKCNMFVPYYKSVKVYTADEIRESLDVFFPLVDYVFVFSYLGGEPFLNHELKDILKYTYQNYHEKIGRIEIISNGSIVPDAETLQAMREYKVLVRISDYTAYINYGKKLEQLVDMLQNQGIQYSVEKSLEWVDFCFPDRDEELVLPIKEIRAHMLCCSPAFHGLNDKKFYYCHVAWSAEKAGLIRLKDSDYIALENYSTDLESKRRLAKYAGGEMEEGFVSLCAECMGCGIDNWFVVPAGKQSDRNIFH